MKVIIYFLFLPFFTTLAQIGEWELKEDGMDFPVSGATAVAWEETIYITGGYSDYTYTNVDWVQEFQPADWKWEKYASLLWPRYGHSTIVKNNNIYCYGGLDDTSLNNSTIEAWQVHSSNPSWVFDYNPNFNRIFSTGLAVGENYYIIGGNPQHGSDSSDISYIVEYNLSSKTITYSSPDTSGLSDFPEQQMSARIGNDIYIFGGVMNGVSDEIYKFNISNHSLTLLPVRLLQPRAGGTAVVNPGINTIYIIGGFNEQQNAMASMEAFSVNGTFYHVAPGPSLNIPRSQIAAVRVSEKIYIFGGLDESGDVLKSVEVLDDSQVVSIFREELIPKFELSQNYPNPFNPTTSISYGLANDSEVKLKIYSLVGEEIKTLVNGRKQAGNYKVEFNASDFSSGVYFYELSTNENIQTKKMMLLK